MVRGRAGVWGVVAAVLGLALLGGCYPVPETTKVVAVGDSLMVGAEAGGLSAALRARGLEPTVDAEVGRRADQAVTLVSSLVHGDSGVLLLGLGTNDGPDRASFRKDIDALMAAAKGWPVVWSLVEGGPALPVNAELRAAAQRYPNLRLIDFNPVVWAHPEYRTPDGIHLTPAGYRARAAFLAEACDQI